ncbi:MAG: ribonuclease Y [Elusimicrobia bacterium]|nr:ribonuclease Y [Elusimicrobiota bacterium]MBU2615393.1 ribonuclease Y [Elusimicrobiota bacterium]
MLIIAAVVSVVIGITVGYFLRILYGKSKLSASETLAKKILADAQTLAEAKKKEALLEVKETLERDRRELEKEFKDRKQEITNQERRINQKEENLERKADIIEKKERDLQERERNMHLKEKSLQDELLAVQKTREEQRIVLERVAGMTAEEAKKILFQNYEDEVRKESALRARSIEQEARETAEKKAKEIVAIAIQRYSADHSTDTTTTTITIQNDEIKGRIIGREGRNIRAFEQATGVDLIVDDTPETITISAFEPLRREIAKISLERLIADGRIHPARIEEVVAKVKVEMEDVLKEIGEKTVVELGIVGINTELLKLIGKLKFRTSYGQNQLQHTIEVAWLSANIAGELGADINMCKKAALLHDIGKAVDHEQEGTHHQISAEIAKKYGESDKMINIILSHHEGFAQPQSVEAFIIAAADAISAARPGARRESVEHYIKRLEKLEKVATDFRGVETAYAIQAGREIRIMVEPEEIDDTKAYALAKDVAKKIEQELEYPGQIKVVVIREIRAQEIAK